jgi:hypothetical protein
VFPLALEPSRRGVACGEDVRGAGGRPSAAKGEAEADLQRVLRCNAKLEDRAQHTATECQAGMGVARSHEVVVVGRRSTLDQIVLQPPCATVVGEGDTKDEQSCCFEVTDAESRATTSCSAGRA